MKRLILILSIVFVAQAFTPAVNMVEAADKVVVIPLLESQSLWQKSGSDIYYNGGNVGVGGLPGTNRLYVFGSPFGDVFSVSTGTSVLDKVTRMVITGAGDVGIGTSTPGAKLDVSGGAVNINNGGEGNVLIYLGTERHWQMRQLGSGADAALELASVGGGGNKDFVITTNGSVVIQPTDVGQDATLVVNGNLEVTGDITGKCKFPPPDYDSGFTWVPQAENVVFTHNLGGDPDDYLVDLTFEDTGDPGLGVHNANIGGEIHDTYYRGGYWENLNSTTITVWRYGGDEKSVRFRVRIWKY